MKRLERSRTDRVLAGVCGGVGRYLGVDSDVVRVVWILAILAGGVGVLPYLAALFLLPRAEGEPEPAVDRTPRNIGLGLLALAGLVIAAQIGFDHLTPWGLPFWGWGVLVPLMLAAAGVLLVWPRTRRAFGVSPEERLARSCSDRVIAGVAGGIGHRAGVDPNLVRLLFVLAAVLTSGLAALVYLLLIAVLPEEAPAAPEPPVAPPGGPDPAPGAGEPDQAPEGESR